MQPAIAALAAAAPIPATMQAASRARALRAAGRDIISLTLGEPGFPTPPHVIAAAHAAALRGETKYPPLRGTKPLIEAVREKFWRDSKIEFAEGEILVAHGGRQIIFDAFAATLDPGTNIVVPAPYWNAYPLIARLFGAATVAVSCAEDRDFLPDPAAIAAAITAQTRWLVLNFPNNPTGAVCPAAHLAAIAGAVRRHPHVWILSDDIYEHLIHGGASNATIAAIAPDLHDRILTLSGVSKSYAMTGWRVGFAGGPERLIHAMSAIQGHSTGGVSPIAQAAATAALTGDQSCIATMRATYAGHARNFAAQLNAIPGLSCRVPQGAFYLFPRVSSLLNSRVPSDEAFATALLEEAGVATVHGTAFGAPGYIRISTAASSAELEAAMPRIARFCASLR